MPAIPAWPPKSLPRLFVRSLLGEGARVELDAGQANYLGNVLRLGAGAELLLFDGQSGEWLARIAEAAKKRMTLIVERQDPRAGDRSRRLARLRAGQARADRLAGRESDRARRRAADPGDDAADDRRAGQARAAARRSRSRRRSNADERALPEIAEPLAAGALLRQARSGPRASISPTNRGASRSRRRSGRARRRS